MRADEAGELAARALARLRALAVPAGYRLWSRIRGFLGEVAQRFTAHRFLGTVALTVLMAAPNDDVFKLEAGLTDDGPVCTVSYDFTHKVHVYGVFTLPVRFRGEVTSVQLDPLPNPLAAERDEKEPGR
ncbi:MAG: hypothetical protein HGA66_18700 [Holophaga sp.]|nr:hypothetical protein [Holophaga sp.]